MSPPSAREGLQVESHAERKLRGFRFDLAGALLGPFAASVMNALEGAWFSLCLCGALVLARR